MLVNVFVVDVLGHLAEQARSFGHCPLVVNHE